MDIDGVNMEAGENGIILTIDAWAIWQQLTDDQKYATIYDEAHHYMFERCVRYGLSESLAGPNFNRATHDLRQMILTDDDLVDNMFVALTKEFANIAERRAEDNKNLRWRNMQLADELNSRGIRLPDVQR